MFSHIRNLYRLSCTWILYLVLTGTVALGQSIPQSPRDVDWYQVDTMQNLSLSQMHWTETSRSDINGVTAIEGTFDAFDWNTYDASFHPITLRWHQRAILFLPPGYPNIHGPGATRGLLYNVHDRSLTEEPHYTVWGVELCRAFAIPVLIHGWDPQLTLPAGYQSINQMQFPLITRFLANGYCQTDDVPIDGSWGVNGNVLVKGDIVAVTLLQRLAESEGGQVLTVGITGISKEGNALWVHAAVDDRLEVIAPGGHPAEDFAALVNAYDRDWGGKDRFANTAGFNLTQLLTRLGRWYAGTPLGQTVDHLSNASTFTQLLYPRVVLVSGDVTLGWMHDKIYPLGVEEQFLSSFNTVPWRYIRAASGTGVAMDGGSPAQAWSIMPMVADLMTGKKLAEYPFVSSVQAEVTPDRRFKVNAVVNTQNDPTATVSLWWATSRDRWWTQVVQGSWTETPMHSLGSGQWESPWSASIPADQAVCYFVEVRIRTTRNTYWFYRIDSSQPAFLWRHEPLKNNRVLWGKCR